MSNIEKIPPQEDPWVIIAELRAQIAQLQEEVKELRAKLNINSTNSSLPPSQDPFKPKKPRKPSGGKRGGQPGHPGHKRKLFSSEEITRMVDLRPSLCPNCQESSFNASPVSVECRQVVELPEIKPDVTQYNIYTCKCGKCGKHVRSDLPKEAERGYGPRLMGFLTTLMGDSQLSKRKICTLSGYLGIKVSLGALCNIHKLASEILEKPYNEVRETVLSQSHVNGDETSWRDRGNRNWVWVGATPNAAFFKIDPSRSQEAFARVFSGFQKTLTTDRYGAYNTHEGNKQACLAHIKRDFVKVSEREEVDGILGCMLQDELGHVFGLWRRFQAGEFARQQMQKHAEEHVENIRVILKAGLTLDEVGNKTRALCDDLLVRFPNLWTFLYEEGVEPTNNLAERALRPVVVWRKLSGGTQSEWGTRLNERLMTVVSTLKLRTQNVFAYLTSCFQAYIRASPIPSAC